MKDFICHICKYKTESKYNFDRHITSTKHQRKTKTIEEKDFIKNCPECGLEFRHSSSYYRHRNYRCQKIDDDVLMSLSNSTSYLDNSTSCLSNSSYLTRPFLEEEDQEKNLKIVELKHQLELIKKENEYRNTISDLEKENLMLELEKNKNEEISELEKKNIVLELQKENVEKILQLEYPTQTQENELDSNKNNKITTRINSKRTNLNAYFNDMIDIDTFIENYRTGDYKLTAEESKILLDNYRNLGAKSYGAGLFYYLKRKCIQQMIDLNGSDAEDTPILPFVLSDSSLRNHLEKTAEGWFSASNKDKIKRLVIISNDQIYEHHKVHITLTPYEKDVVANSILRKSDYHNAFLIIQKRKKDEIEFIENQDYHPHLETQIS